MIIETVKSEPSRTFSRICCKQLRTSEELSFSKISQIPKQKVLKSSACCLARMVSRNAIILPVVIILMPSSRPTSSLSL